MLQFLIDQRELCALHSANIRLCLSCPNYGKNLPGGRLSDVFTYLGDLLPSPAPCDQSDFDLVLNEIAVLISGLLEYHSLSQAVFRGNIVVNNLYIYLRPVIYNCKFSFLILHLDLAKFITQSGRLSRDCQIQLNTILDLQSRQSQLGAQVCYVFYFYY